ncbi:MAG: DUF4157 domain-containing protein [Dinghuibacter sp.]|nr:DUF4157 domain-containing protein [Dinghuibacter sp.]
MIRSSSYRTQCPRGRHSALEEKQEAPAEPFFVKAEKQGTANSTGQPFFQTKLNIGQPNDKYEQEADAVASKVVNNSGAGTVVQQKEITGIQRLSTSKEEEKAATADARMVKDREIQEKPEIQRLATDKQEEKLGTNDQRMRRDKEIQTKPEIQRMCPGCEQEEKDGSVVQRKKGIKEEEGPVQKKTDGGTATTASSSLSSRIESSSGKGNKLPAGTMAEMSNSFGVDFSHVNVHTNNEAVGMNRELGAQAFTHGSDIYFNSGKYNPETSTGKHLLAHELTHVVQQNSTIQKKMIQKDADTCTYGEFRQYAYTSGAGFPAPAGLGNMKMSIGAACSRGNPCSCYSGASATGAQDQAAWRNIVAASGSDSSNGANIICVDTQQCSLVQQCRPIYQPGQQRPPLRNRATPLQPVATLTVNGGTVYFYSDPRNGNCGPND